MNSPTTLASLTVVGSGTMGHGIAQVAAHAGLKVTLVDLDRAALERGRARIEENLAGGIARGKLTEADRDRVRAHLSTGSDAAAAASGSDLVIEAIVEKLEAKQALFRAVEAAAPPHAILASNTSSLPIGKIAATLKTPSRLVGIRVSWMTALGWGMATALGSIAGMLIAPVVFLEPNMMISILLYGFAGAVLGGLTSPGGAVLGGFAVGVIENLAGTYIPVVGSELKLPIALVVIVVVLVFKPAGLFGRVVVSRV